MKQASTVYFAAVFLTFNLYLISCVEGVAEKAAFTILTICTLSFAAVVYKLDRKQEQTKNN